MMERNQTVRRWTAGVLVTIAGLSLALLGGPAETLRGAEPEKPAPENTELAQAAQQVPAEEKEKESHPLDRPIELAKTAREAIAQLDSYQASFIKKEFVNGQQIVHHMRIKHRTDPFSVYLYFLRPSEGREVIYVEGENNGMLLAHESGVLGLVGTVALQPNSPRALSESRHPITSIGMLKMVEGIIGQWEAERKYNEVRVKYYPQAELGEASCLVIESSHPNPRRHFPYHMTRLYIEKERNFPVRVEQHAFPRRPNERPPLVGEYTYWDIDTDVNLTDADFDTNNPNYGF